MEEDPKSALMRLAMQVLLEELNEAKARDMLGRDYYERSESASTALTS